MLSCQDEMSDRHCNIENDHKESLFLNQNVLSVSIF